MSIVNQLSSQVEDKTEKSNIEVANKCLANPGLLKEIAEGLKSTDKKLAADCAEVFTKVAEEKPEIVIDYADDLKEALETKETKLRWEAVHALSLIAHLVPDKITPILPKLYNLVHEDKSMIVRDYCVDTIANYAKANDDSAKKAYSYLKECLKEWGGKHANRALEGFKGVAKHKPELSSEIKLIAEEYIDHPKGVVKKVAKQLLKEVS